jgi:uncharacterized protein YdhG (YjbR/CyaY superfamily)
MIMAAYNTIDEYIDTFPENVRTMLNQLRQIIQETAPEAQETINYQMPTFTLHGNLVHFAAFKNHIGFYPTPTGIKPYKRTGSLPVAKGSVNSDDQPATVSPQIVEYK